MSNPIQTVLNANLIAPSIASSINATSKYHRLIVFHMIGFCFAVIVIESLWYVINTTQTLGFAGTFFVLYFVEFFIPPVIVGSLVYSLRKRALYG